MPVLPTGLEDVPCVFVVGKGGVGKTTTAGGLALARADRGSSVHLITTDPAESLGDLFGVPLEGGRPVLSPCSDKLTLEAFEARAWAERWMAPRRSALAEIVERGTYLEQADVDGILSLAVPGIDEAMGALRLVELAATQARGVVDQIVVDTAPTGHTLRLLDAGSALAGWVRTLRAMASKAAVVASSLLHTPVSLQGERVLDEIEADLAALDGLLRSAAFVVVHRQGTLVHAETVRLAERLVERGLRIAAFVGTGEAAPVATGSNAQQLRVPLLSGTTGCDGLRRWAAALDGHAEARAVMQPPAAWNAAPAPPARSAARWLRQQPWQLVWFAGKGGVGKSTCAAAAAIGLAGDRRVLVHSADPAGSLGDLFGCPVGAAPVQVAERLRAQQVDATAAFDQWRAEYRAELTDVFERLGISDSMELDRRVLESTLDLAPLGIDEIVSLEGIIDVLDGDETLIVDTAPTGHFLRLLEMPSLALDWAHALLRILLHHGAGGSLDAVSQRVLAFAKQLKVLRSTLSDPDRAAVFVVTLEEPMVRAETERLRTALRAAAVTEAGVIVNRADSTARLAARRLLRAPELDPPPAGVAALHSFFERWELV